MKEQSILKSYSIWFLRRDLGKFWNLASPRWEIGLALQSHIFAYFEIIFHAKLATLFTLLQHVLRRGVPEFLLFGQD